MKNETLFLRIVVFLIGIPILGVCILLANVALGVEPENAYLIHPVLIIIYATAIPFFFALYQTLKLLSYIHKNTAFSDLSVKSLKHIKNCAITISILYGAGMPFIFRMAHADDAPGLVAFGLMNGFASLVVAVLAAVLQKLLKNAIDIKRDNDLTI
jgi:hypothetical protein